MPSGMNLVNVTVSVNGQKRIIKMEKGTRFENKGGIFTAGENNNVLKMTNYQLKVFETMANNYAEKDEKGIVLSNEDIKIAQQKYRKGSFVADISEFLPAGYRIERPKLTSAENMVQAYVTNGKESQSATLKFSIVDVQNTQTVQRNSRAKEVSREDMEALSINDDGKFSCDTYTWQTYLPVPLWGVIDEYLQKEFMQCNGKQITPDLIDKLVNIQLDYENKHPDEMHYGGGEPTGDGIIERLNILGDIARFAEYLKPETINKLLNTKDIFYNDYTGIKDMKTLYNRLTKEQQQKYYSHLFDTTANIDHNMISSNCQQSGSTLAALIFEPKLSNQTYNKLKNFVSVMNEPGNGIAYTGTECKNLIDALKAKGQITQQQANELYKSANIK